MTTNERLAPELRIALTQHDVVTDADLRAAGLTRSAIRHRVRTGRLHPVHPRVYAVGRPTLTSAGRRLAAVLACGPGAALSHRAAGRLWGVLERGGDVPEVAVPSQSGRRGPEGVVLHRAATLSPAETTVRDRIPVTTLPRTLLDLAGALDERQLRAAVRQAVRLHHLDLRALRGYAAVPANDHRRARLRRVVDRYVPREELTESELEARFDALCDGARIPRPVKQRWIGAHRVDFVWPDLRLVVETDGARDHLTIVAFHEDRAKDRALRAAGYEVLRFTWAEVVNTPSVVARELRGALKRRASDAEWSR